jgi:L-ascorbate metabolism protein UlaG (beta-lactamase superfamily)
MEISFLGMNCVRITSKDLAVLCDPYGKASGLADIKLTNDVTLLTLPVGDSGQGELKAAELPAKAGMVIDGPGEYEVKGAMITGAPAKFNIDPEEAGQRAAIYAIMAEGLHVAYLGNVASELSAEQVEALGQVDILIIPVGGHGLTPDAQAAAKLISQLEPKYVIPTHYDDGKTKYEVPQDKLEVFLKEVGSSAEPQPKLRVSTRDLPAETTVVVLSVAGN